MSAFNQKIPLKTFRSRAVRATVYETPTPLCGVSLSVGLTSGQRDDENFDVDDLMSIIQVVVEAHAFIMTNPQQRSIGLWNEDEV
ncbi:hypothetical protein [Stratiformator vulcanicus]|uniref:Uncharacterized protein n=1 Tax=Stratiformator vulcanicus TaxID=2527980 RepID=A0A517R1F7_9PLAN|nr:hypothetical protein [Stratiformator vulcanicus]QDT37684.1 hypothetical protein Pan189_20660 [Stratiformator vulcanicus]